MQILIQLTLCDIDLPAKTSDFFSIINQIAAFDFYEGLSDDINWVLGLDPTEAFSEKFAKIGYESIFILNNMGTSIFLFIGYPCFILL